MLASFAIVTLLITGTEERIKSDTRSHKPFLFSFVFPPVFKNATACYENICFAMIRNDDAAPLTTNYILGMK